MKILISGYNGFLGRHLIRKLKCLKEEYDIDFLSKADFESNKLKKKISPNDIIFHFAGVNRDIDDNVVFEKNNFLNELLLSALVEVKFKGKLLFTSSVQEYSGTLYGKAKKDARLKFKESSKKLGFKFYGIIAPNIFGPFCKPNYNSFIATFSSMLIEKQNPINVWGDGKDIKDFLYIDDFVDALIKVSNLNKDFNIVNISSSKKITINKILNIMLNINNMNQWKIKYQKNVTCDY